MMKTQILMLRRRVVSRLRLRSETLMMRIIRRRVASRLRLRSETLILILMRILRRRVVSRLRSKTLMMMWILRKRVASQPEVLQRIFLCEPPRYLSIPENSCKIPVFDKMIILLNGFIWSAHNDNTKSRNQSRLH